MKILPDGRSRRTVALFCVDVTACLSFFYCFKSGAFVTPPTIFYTLFDVRHSYGTSYVVSVQKANIDCSLSIIQYIYVSIDEEK